MLWATLQFNNTKQDCSTLDEVFTPPEFANRMLDTLAEVWAADHGGASLRADKTVRFLDPCAKSGVFLRGITSRLTKGLADDLPDLEARVNHILTQQVYRIGIVWTDAKLYERYGLTEDEIAFIELQVAEHNDSTPDEVIANEDDDE